MTCNNPKLDLANINAYINLDKILSICSQHIERKRNFGENQGPKKGHNYGTIVRKMTCNNHKLDLANINAYIYNLVKFSQLILNILSGTKCWRKSSAITLVQISKNDV